MQRVFKTRNGHEMSLSLYFEMGGAPEELSFWCHTCDPEGSSTNTYDLRWTTIPLAIKDASAFADEHSKE